MKNIFKIVAVGVLLFAGSQFTQAQELKQDQSRPEVLAKAEIAKMDAVLELSADQERAVFRALVSKTVNYRKLIDNKDPKDATTIGNKAKIDDNFNLVMKKALGEKKYKAWLAMQEQ